MPDRLARAFWSLGDGRGELRPEQLTEPNSSQVLVRALASGISRGTESLVFQGRVPPSQHEVMRCPHQIGNFPGPVKYGYSSVGLVEAGDPSWVGKRVFCLHPHQDRYVVASTAVNAIPDSVPAERAVLAANLETAVNALWDATPRLGDHVAVVGAGVVGCLVATLLARIPGVKVELIDLDPRRQALAEELGCRGSTPEAASRDADLVIHTSASSAGLATSLSLAGFEATVLELSWYGDRPVSVPLGEGFHSRRLNLRSSQVGTIATTQRARWNYRRRLELVMTLLQEPVFDHLLSRRSRFHDLPQTMVRLSTAPDGTLCEVVSYD
jgi:threonine dehydrogenase-like Zn-dependent dehydrogenase